MSPTAYLYLADVVAFVHMAVLAYVLVGQAVIVVAHAMLAPWAVLADLETVGPQVIVVNAGTLGLVAGPVSINSAATLAAPGGTIHVTSAAGSGEVPVDPPTLPP